MGATVSLDERLLWRLPRIVFACAVMGVTLWGAAWALAPLLETATLRYAALLALVLAGSVAYFGAAHITGALRLSEVRGALRR